MKKVILFAVVTVFVLAYSSCKKTCDDASAPNYNQTGTCTDLTTALSGSYSGSFLDSIPTNNNQNGGNTTGQATITITKVDDSHVQITAPGLNWFQTVNATVTTASNGFALTVQSTNTNNVVTNGAGTYFNLPNDGVYNTTTNQFGITALITNTNSNTSFYEVFLGTHN